MNSPLIRKYLLTAFLVLASLLAATEQARAEAEFCPARVLETHTFDSGNTHITAIRMVATSPRSVHGHIAIYSNAHLFIAPFSEVPFEKDVAHIATDTSPFDLTQYMAPVVYVRTAGALDPSAAFWVADGQTTGETEFGWDAKQKVLCTPPAGLGLIQPSPGPQPPSQNRTNPLPAWKLPSDATTAALAQEVPMPSATCDQPAAYPKAVDPHSPAMPTIGVASLPVVVAAEVALDSTGKIVDVWLERPSPYKRFNDATLDAAQSTTFTPGRSFCTNVPGTYLFEATFDQ